MSAPQVGNLLSQNPVLYGARRAADTLLYDLMWLTFEPAQNEGRPSRGSQPNELTFDARWWEFSKWYCFQQSSNRHLAEAQCAIANARDLLAPDEPCEIAGFKATSHAEALLSVYEFYSAMARIDLRPLMQAAEVLNIMLRETGTDAELNVKQAIDLVFMAGMSDVEFDEYLEIEVTRMQAEEQCCESPREACDRWRRTRTRLRGSFELNTLIEAVDWAKASRIVSRRLQIDAVQLQAKLDIEFRKAALACPGATGQTTSPNIGESSQLSNAFEGDNETQLAVDRCQHGIAMLITAKLSGQRLKVEDLAKAIGVNRQALYANKEFERLREVGKKVLGLFEPRSRSKGDWRGPRGSKSTDGLLEATDTSDSDDD